MAINFSEYRINDVDNKLRQAGFRPLDVMVPGVTGAGKSTTLNSFFQKQITKVGNGVAPETMEIHCYRLNRMFRIWDTPGLGDGVKIDRIHKEKMTNLLHRIYISGIGPQSRYALISFRDRLYNDCDGGCI